MSNQKIRKAVIPAAGLGTRFLPWTKNQSKELLPIVDRPAIHYIVKELVDSGIEEVIFVLTPGREGVLDYFRESPELKKHLEENKKSEQLALLQEVYDLFTACKISKVYQKEALGLGHSVLCAADAIQGEPFVVVLPDDLMDSQTPAIGQMIQVYEAKAKSVVGVQLVPDDKVSSYGIVATSYSEGVCHQISDMVEKPSLNEAPSRLGIIGRYLFEAEIFEFIRQTKPGKQGEIQLTDAMKQLAAAQGMFALELEGERLDVGNPQAWLAANQYFSQKKLG